MDQSDAPDIPLQPRLAGFPVPLTAGQRFMWDTINRKTRLSERMCAASVRLLGRLSTCLLQRSIEAVVQRHESLRTRIITVDGIPRQHIDPVHDDHFEIIDLAKISQISAEIKAKRIAHELIDEKIDLSSGPLFKAKLLRLSNREHVLILVLHHIVSDAISYAILNRDIWALFNQAAQGRPFTLPPLPVQFADYAVWQHRTHAAWCMRHEAYWRARLTGAPHTQLPIDDDLLEAKHCTLTMQHFPFSKALSGKLRELALRERTLLPLVVLSIYAAVVSRWCGQRDLVLTFTVHGRHARPELENVIGLLASSLPLRIEITKEDSFIDLLKRIHLEFYSSLNHHGSGRWHDTLPKWSTDVDFNWLPATWSRRSVHPNEEANGPIRIQPFPVEPSPTEGDPNFKFSPMYSDTSAGIVMTLMYLTDLFTRSTVERFAHNFRQFAEVFTDHPLARVASAPFAP